MNTPSSCYQCPPAWIFPQDQRLSGKKTAEGKRNWGPEKSFSKLHDYFISTDVFSQQVKPPLGTRGCHMRAVIQALTVLLSIQFPVKCLGSLQLKWQTWREFPALGFSLAQPHLLWSFQRWNSRLKIIRSLPLLHNQIHLKQASNQPTSHISS